MSRPKNVGSAIRQVIRHQKASNRPLAIVLAGHNGSGKSTLWYRHLANDIRIPLINADRMMLSVLPEPDAQRRLPPWAQKLRDTDLLWMSVAQKGVDAFVAQSIGHQVPFAVETVFSHWQPRADGSIASKIDLVKQMQRAGYFVLLVFVGLAHVGLSIGRVQTRRAQGGHDVDHRRLIERFPRTQQAIRAALPVVDAAILVDNSLSRSAAFTPCSVQVHGDMLYDVRTADRPSAAITAWLDAVAPRF